MLTIENSNMIRKEIKTLVEMRKHLRQNITLLQNPDGAVAYIISDAMPYMTEEIAALRGFSLRDIFDALTTTEYDIAIGPREKDGRSMLLICL